MNSTKIVQISDLHCGSSRFDSNLMERTIERINDLDPDVLIVTGDLTMDGYYDEYEIALSYLEKMKVKQKVILPGNHDSRNVGYRTFEKLIGEPFQVIKHNDILICGVDSTEPDLDEGSIGRTKNAKLKEVFSEDFRVKIMALHHHVIPIPNSGRERNVLVDAGDVLKMAVKTGVNVILSGHKHVPYLWNFENMKVVTCSTTTSRRIRGIYKASFNIIEISEVLKIIQQEVEGDSKVIYSGKI